MHHMTDTDAHPTDARRLLAVSPVSPPLQLSLTK